MELENKTIENCLAVIERLDERIKGLEKELKQIAEESGDAKLLMTIPGVGYFSATENLFIIGVNDIRLVPPAAPQKLRKKPARILPDSCLKIV